MRTVSNQRNTEQRRIILEELRGSRFHPTAAELYQMVRKRLPRVSLGTVYRNLEILSRNEAIHKLEMGGAEARFDGEIRPHHHARCVECDAVDDLFDIPENVVPPRHMKPGAFDIQGYRIEFYGLCAQCRPVADNENHKTEIKKDQSKKPRSDQCQD